MSLTRERELIKKWASQNSSEKVFPAWSSDGETYFTDSTSIYMMEYGFKNAPELEKLLSDVWKNQQCDTIKEIMAVSAIKCMPADNSIELSQTDSKIPQYIYAF